MGARELDHKYNVKNSTTKTTSRRKEKIVITTMTTQRPRRKAKKTRYCLLCTRICIILCSLHRTSYYNILLSHCAEDD